jgi:phage terminase small subunit
MDEPTIVVAFPQDGRPPAPAHLSPAETETWKAVIASRKSGHFGPEIFPVLEAYCTTALACDHIAARLRIEEGIDHTLLETYDRATHSLSDLAKALGLLPASAGEHE